MKFMDELELWSICCFEIFVALFVFQRIINFPRVRLDPHWNQMHGNINFFKYD